MRSECGGSGRSCPGDRRAGPAGANFVELDNDLHGLTYWDTASVVRKGDWVEFDTFRVSYLYSVTPVRADSPDAGKPQTPTASVNGILEHRAVSCGWRVSRQAIASETYDAAGAPRTTRRTGTSLQDSFLSSKSRLLPAIEAACRGERSTAQGYPSVAATLAAGTAKMAAPLKALPISPRRPPPVEPEWSTRRHGFVRVPFDDPDGTLAFVDAEATHRRGERATSLILVVLGASGQRDNAAMSDVVTLRRVEIDCARRTLEVEEQANWNRFGEFDGAYEQDFAPWPASQSPALAAQVDAVCAVDEAAPGQAKIASVQDAWAFARSRWPAETRVWHPACMWDRIPAEYQSGFIEAFKKAWPKESPRFTDDSVRQLIALCGIPAGDEQRAIRAFHLFSLQRGARAILLDLVPWTVDDASLRAAWYEQPWADRARYTRMLTQTSPDDRPFRGQLMRRLAVRLKLDDSAKLGTAMGALDAYMTGLASIDDD